jgi:hypothetical protein
MAIIPLPPRFDSLFLNQRRSGDSDTQRTVVVSRSQPGRIELLAVRDWADELAVENCRTGAASAECDLGNREADRSQRRGQRHRRGTEHHTDR